VQIEHITGKYTGHPVTWEELLAAGSTGDPVARALAHALQRTADAVGDAETELTRIADSIDASLATVRANVEATAGQAVPTVNTWGELQANGPRFDTLIGRRDERIAHLRALTRLWQTATATEAAPPSGVLGPALISLGLQTIAPAHATTAAAYRHRRGDRHLDVSLHPHGAASIEINASDAGTAGWTATFGPDTPTPVVVAAVRAALHLHRMA